MKLSTRVRYGTRALIELAAAPPRAPLSVHALSETQQISAKYLERIMARLLAARLVKPVPGRGYVLAKAARLVRMNRVVWILEGSHGITPCRKARRTCPRIGTCVARRLWEEVDRCLDRCLSNITLADLAAERSPKKRRKAGAGAF
jgi:Rrf2 family protein